jgi:hypothetical protein
MLLDDPSLDERLSRCARYGAPGMAPDALGTAVAARTARRARLGEPVRVALHGPDRAGRRAACLGVAEALRAPLLEADVARGLDDGEFGECLAAALRARRSAGASASPPNRPATPARADSPSVAPVAPALAATSPNGA